MFVAERFIGGLIKIHGQNIIFTDGGNWYPHVCKFLKLDHHFHFSYEKSAIERTMQYIKDRTESLDDYFRCNRKEKECDLFHVKKLANLIRIHP